MTEETDQAQSAPSEPISAGREALEKAAGYEPLKVDKPADADRDALAQAIGLHPDQIPEQREEEIPPPRPLIDPNTGTEIADNTSLTVEQASEMVSRNIAQEQIYNQAMTDAELASQIDAVQASAAAHLANQYGPAALDQFMAQQQAQQEAAARAAEAKVQQQAQAEAQQAEGEQIGEQSAQPQAQEQPGEDGLTPSARALLSNPQIRADLEATYGQFAQAQQAYTQATAQAIQAASLSLMADVPEFQGMNDAQISGAMAMMQQNQPERYAQIMGRIQNLAGMSQQLQAHVAQQQQAAFQAKAYEVHNWIQNQDAQFEQYAAKEIPKAERELIAREAQQMLIDYGVPENELGELWNNSVLRSAAAQRIMADAARYRIATRNAHTRARPNVPPVQKPGQGIPQGNTLNRQIAELEGKSSLSLKEAAKLVELQGKRRSRKVS